jgi:hypothetical protein
MRVFGNLVIAAVAVLAIGAPANARSKFSDVQIKQRIIKQSIAEYPGSCACPYNSARNGSSCGGRSAWSRGGGYAPMCYAKDVSAAQVRSWRQSN